MLAIFPTCSAKPSNLAQTVLNEEECSLAVIGVSSLGDCLLRGSDQGSLVLALSL